MYAFGLYLNLLKMFNQVKEYLLYTTVVCFCVFVTYSVFGTETLVRPLSKSYESHRDTRIFGELDTHRTDNLTEWKEASDYLRNITPGICDQRAIPNLSKMMSHPIKIPIKRIEEDTFTIVMLTHNRTLSMLRSIRHFSRMLKVSKIIVYWNNPGQELPILNRTMYSNKVVISRYPAGNHLKDRLYPNSNIKTQGVFSLDDDILMDEHDMNVAFDKWKVYPWALVGFVPRGFTVKENGEHMYHGAKRPTSMILAGAAFLHRDYLSVYRETLPPPMADMMDRINNCEDIAINFVVAAHCECAHAYYVKPRRALRHEETPAGSLWRRHDHMVQRGECGTQFARAFNRTLIETNC